VSLIRKFLLYFEFALFAAIQGVGLASSVIALAPAFAKGPAGKNPDLEQDFMATLPPSDNMRRNPSYNAETIHPFEAGPATYRIYNHKNGQAKQALLLQAQTAFSGECSAKGGVIALRDGRDYAFTTERLRPSAPDATILICIKPDRTALGMLITLKRSVRQPDPNGDLGTAAIGLLFNASAPYYLIALQPPASVFTQDRLDREAAERTAVQQRQSADRDWAAEQERVEVERWRRTIKAGTETGCGPVLRVNGDLIEVVYFQTREPKWFRRSELWPERFTKGGLRTCS
jgi:hypothetical protein